MASLILKSICKLNPLSRSILWPTAARYLTTEPPTATPPTSQTEKETSKPIAAAAGEDETLNLNEEEFSILSSKTKLKLQALQNEAQIKNHPFNIAKATKIFKSQDWQPTPDTFSALTVDGVPYNKLPVISIKASSNNTIMTLSEANGVTLYTTTGGTVGFKNAKKSTAVAGQAAGLAMSDHAKRRGIKHVRVIVKGLGNGRLASIKALQMGKLNIVSVTDNTIIPLPFSRTPRPPARRRL